MDPAEAVYEVVRGVPAGRVVTYGQVADMVEGIRVTAREVGAMMNSCPPDVPWQRVVGAGGHLPIGKRGHHLLQLQKQLLLAEGVLFRGDERVDMESSQLRAPDPIRPGLFDE